MRETVDQRIDALIRSADISRPQGAGPHPLVIQLHGCGGKKPPQARWAKAALAAGWAAAVVDSYPHRGIDTLQAYSTVCTGLRLWGRERAGDLFAMMEWARRQDWVKADRIVAAGWSHGGWTILDAMALKPGAEMASATRLDGLPEDPLLGLAGAFVVYPYVGPGSLAARRGLVSRAPVDAIVGTHDVIVGGRGNVRILERIAAPHQMRVHLLEGATHAFDEHEARDLRVRYSRELTERAEKLYCDFLARCAADQPKAPSG